jgi:outer membrane protein TolC
MNQITCVRSLAAALLCAFVVAVPPVLGQSGAASESGSVSTPRPINPSANTTNPSTRATQAQNPYLGSTPSGPVSATPVTMSFDDAVQRGVRYNLGLIDGTISSADAGSARLRALAALLPTITARASQVYENLSLKEIGLTLPGLPEVTGGFGFQDVRIGISQSLYSGELRNRYRSEQAAERAAAMSARDARDVVVFAVGTAYFQIVASVARLDTAKAQLLSAQEFARRAADRVTAEVAADIESLRAQVELQTAEQRVINAEHDLEKDELTLARIIGLPIEQRFDVEPFAPYRAVAVLSEATVKADALRARADLAAAAANIDAAEFNLRAQRAQQSPVVGVNADYGAGGDIARPNQVYTVAVGVSVPLYTGGRIRADVERAQHELARRRAEYDDLAGRVAYDARVAWLDLNAAGSSVTVAQRNTQFADRVEEQALDRYANGVTSYLEVVQARETVAHAHENLTASLYAFNVAKLAVARAVGDSATAAKELFRHEP